MSRGQDATAPIDGAGALHDAEPGTSPFESY